MGVGKEGRQLLERPRELFQLGVELQIHVSLFELIEPFKIFLTPARNIKSLAIE